MLMVWAVFPFLAKASVYISEIMYDIDGSDDKKEWIEIYNDNAGEINLKDWRFYDGSNHILNEPPANGGRGSLVLPAYSYAILSSDATTTVANSPAYSGAVIDTVMSLGNTSETLKIIDASGAIIDAVSYNSSMGANGDGNSLQKINGVWSAKSPTFGYINASSAQSSSSSSQESQSSSANSSSSSVSENIASGSIAYNYKNEQISAIAGEHKTAVAGADVVLEGNALGFKKEPLENARYLWTPGDGSSKEGKNIRHIYKYPGNYIAVLNVSSGNISASDRINIKVIPNELIIIETKNEFIKLKNKSGVILDVSGWFLKVGGAIFKFPDYSLVAADAELMISSDISSIKFADNNFSAEILYPNGSAAFSYPSAGEAGPPVYLSSSSSISKPKEIISSQPTERKAEVAVVSPAIYLKNYSSSSAAADSRQNFTTGKNLPALPTGQAGGEAGLASVITIGDKDNSGAEIWLILAVITGIIGGAGVFLARKNNQSPKN